MPQPFNSSNELSLRHLPDVSDSSFSFQIPGATRDDNLLVDDDLDFFKGADVSIAPLASTTEPPFTTVTNTPKPEKPASSFEGGRNLDSFPTLSYHHSEDRDTNPKQKKANLHQVSKVTTNVNVLSKTKSNVITTSSTVLPSPSSQGSPAVRLDNLRVELDLFSDNLLAGPSTTSINHHHHPHHNELPTEVRLRPKGILRKSLGKKKLQIISPRNHQKVIEGGISKTRCATKLPAPDRTGTLPIQENKQNTMLSDAEQVNRDYSFADSSMSSAAAGVAGRLVMYSQKLVNSFGLAGSDGSLEPTSACQASTSQDQQAGACVDQDADIPLTLSQLSPKKASPSRDPTPTPRDDASMRIPGKRPISAASNVLQQRKKSKTDAASAEVSVSKPTAVLKSRLPLTKKHPKPISSELRLDRSRERKATLSRVNGPTIEQLPVFKPEAPELDDTSRDMGIATAASSSRCATGASMTRRVKNSHEKDAEPVNSITLNDKGKTIASSSHGSSRVAYHAPQPATKPVSFNIDVHKDGDQDRDDGRSEKRHHQSSTTIPDFKAMHAAQEAELALRKENIKPVVPLPIHWETDYRLKERQKFDERMREKEREQERLMELRRQEREEQEEREVRELRKRAVPKAHEVPEWYKEAPKKKKDNAIVE